MLIDTNNDIFDEPLHNFKKKFLDKNFNTILNAIMIWMNPFLQFMETVWLEIYFNLKKYMRHPLDYLKIMFQADRITDKWMSKQMLLVCSILGLLL